MASNLVIIIGNLIQAKPKTETLKKECLEEYFNIRGGVGNSTLDQVIYLLLNIINKEDEFSRAA